MYGKSGGKREGEGNAMWKETPSEHSFPTHIEGKKDEIGILKIKQGWGSEDGGEEK